MSVVEVSDPAERSRLCEIVGASLNVRQCRGRRIPPRNAVEPATAFVRLATPGRFNRVQRSRKQRLRRRRHEILVEEHDLVVACISLRPHELRRLVDR